MADTPRKLEILALEVGKCQSMECHKLKHQHSKTQCSIDALDILGEVQPCSGSSLLADGDGAAA